MTYLIPPSNAEGIYEIRDLESARDFLLEMIQSKTKIVLSNAPCSTRYYGMRVIDRMFKSLQEEFPNQISSIVVNAEGDPVALHTAKQLGYKTIHY